MTRKELSDYILLQDIFQRRCEEICGMLTPLNDSYRYLSDFEIYSDPDEVWGEGDEYWSYGGHEHHSQKFPSNFLWKDDGEIKQYVEDELKKREQAKEAERFRIQRIQEEAQEKRDIEEYERLKKKFEKN
jgi:hypothetical protein